MQSPAQVKDHFVSSVQEVHSRRVHAFVAQLIMDTCLKSLGCKTQVEVLSSNLQSRWLRDDDLLICGIFNASNVAELIDTV